MAHKFSKRWDLKSIEQRRIRRKSMKKMMEAMLNEIEYEREEDKLTDMDDISFDDGET